MTRVEAFHGNWSAEQPSSAATPENPELDYLLHKTAKFVIENLVSFGITHTKMGIVETGIVAPRGRSRRRVDHRNWGDLDALPIIEESAGVFTCSALAML